MLHNILANQDMDVLVGKVAHEMGHTNEWKHAVLAKFYDINIRNIFGFMVEVFDVHRKMVLRGHTMLYQKTLTKLVNAATKL